jgi:tRNA nucleotidyltransferase (CCA-adding enzyme)
MSDPSSEFHFDDESSECTLTDEMTEEMIAEILAEVKANSAAGDLLYARFKQGQAEIEEERRALNLPTFKEMEAAVIESGAYWIVLEAENSVVDLHKQAMAKSKPYDLKSFVHPALHSTSSPSLSEDDRYSQTPPKSP